jgi:hypothetical protein
VVAVEMVRIGIGRRRSATPVSEVEFFAKETRPENVQRFARRFGWWDEEVEYLPAVSGRTAGFASP